MKSSYWLTAAILITGGLALTGCPGKNSPSSPAPAPTSTPAASSTPTNSPTITPSSTPSGTPTKTGTPTLTATPTNTATPSPTATVTDTPTITLTATPTLSPTLTLTVSPTATITATPTVTGTPTITFTPNLTVTATSTSTVYYTGSYLGVYGAYGSGPGTFVNPTGMAVTVSGGVTTLYVSDTYKYDIEAYNSGSGTWSLFAEVGSSYLNEGIALDASGDLWVAEAGLGAIVKYSGGTSVVYPGADLTFPYGVAYSASGTIYVSNPDTVTPNIAILAYNIGGSSWTTLGGYPGGQPLGVAVDSSGNLYTADGKTNIVYKYNGSTWSSFAGSGATQGSTNGQTMDTYSVAVDPQNNVYVADLYYFVNMYDSSGGYLRQFVAGTGYLQIEGVAVDVFGDVYFPAFHDAIYPINVYIKQ